MKQLTCEMCGSTDLLKQDGVFVCQTCGTKYSVEEAKKMMIEGTVNVSGTVKVDNTDKIKNYLEMANSAYEAGNKNEAESYCNRIIEIEPQNYEAWFMKGKAAGWQTKLSNIRIEESVQCFSKAIDYSPEDKLEEIKKTASEEISSLSLALIKLTCDNFGEYPSIDNFEDIKMSCVKSLEFTIQLLSKCGVGDDDYKNHAASYINGSAVKAYGAFLKEFRGERYPDSNDLSRLISGLSLCESVIAFGIKFAKDDYSGNVTRYKNLIEINNTAINSKAWDSKYIDYAGLIANDYNKKGIRAENEGRLLHVQHYKLTDDAIAKRKAIISQYESEMKNCETKAAEKKAEESKKKEAEQKAKNEAYWNEHADDKKKLESESVELHSKLEQLKSQMSPYDKEILSWKNKREAGTPAQAEKEKIESQISQLQLEISSLGIFKGKEKKELQSQIDSLKARIPAIKESIEQEEKEQIKFCNDKIREIEQTAQPIKDEIAKKEKRLNEINTELTKDR